MAATGSRSLARVDDHGRADLVGQRQGVGRDVDGDRSGTESVGDLDS